MDARKEPAIAPLFFVRRENVRAKVGLRRQAKQCAIDRWQVRRRSARPVRDWSPARAFEPAANKFGKRRLDRFRNGRRRDRIDLGIESRFGIDALCEIEALGARPERARRPRSVVARRCRDKFVVERAPLVMRRSDDERRSASCNSSALRTTGHDSSVTSAIAAGSRMPTPSRVAARIVRRSVTARARRSSSGASSRYAYGLALKISWQNADGSGVSTATVRSSPRSRRPRISIQTVEIHRFVQAVVDGFAHERMIGNANRPGRDSPDRPLDREIPPRSSLRSACAAIAAELFVHPRTAESQARASRSNANARQTSAPASSACVSTYFTLADLRNSKTISSGKACGRSAKARCRCRLPQPAARN